jgi:hypothetical protein
MTTVLDVITDTNLLGPYFAGPSWANWRVVLKATFGLRMTDAERDAFRTLADREPPPGRVREAFFAVGRRGGKDSIASPLQCTPRSTATTRRCCARASVRWY